MERNEVLKSGGNFSHYNPEALVIKQTNVPWLGHGRWALSPRARFERKAGLLPWSSV